MPDSQVNNKRIAKNTLLLYIRSVLLLVINLYTSRVVLDALGVDDYGISAVVGGVVGLFSMLSGTLASASQRFITFALGRRDAAWLKKVFSNSLTLHIVLGAIIVVLLEIVGIYMLYNQLNIPESRMGVAGIVLQSSIVTLFFGMIIVPYNALIIAHERMSAFAFISILGGVMKLLIALYLLICGSDRLVVYAVLQTALTGFLLLIYYFYSKRNFSEGRNTTLHIDRQLFKEMFGFAGWNLLGQGSMVLRNQGIDILLNIFFGVSVNAAKGICNQVQHAITQFASNFSVSIQPQLTMSVAQNDINRTHSLIFHGSRLYFFMMMIFTVPLMNVTEDVLKLWLVKVPPFTVDMVVVMLIYLQGNTLSRLLINAVLAQGDIKYFQIFSGGTKLLALPIAYLVLKLGGSPLTGIWVNIALDFCCRGINLFFTHKLLQYSAWRNVFKAELPCWLTFGCALLLSYLSYRYISSNMFIAVIISFIITVASIWLVGLDKKEQTFILNQVRTVISKKLKKR